MLPSPATNDAPLPLDARQDVLATAVHVAERSMWVVKDPITLEQHELGEAEYLLLTTLGKRISLRDLQRAYQQQFAPKTVEPAEIQNYLARLHQAGLLVARAAGQGSQLVERASEKRATRLRWSWAELLAIRLRGVDPDRLLDRLAPLARVLLHPLTLVAAAIVVFAAVGLLISHSEQFIARLPTLATLLAPSNWLWMLLVVAVVKLLHELAHALTAKHMGAEVHEMGVLFLVFMPTLYCDVTDIWNLPSKWRRMAVSAAGMAAELVIASLATFVWWFTEPGLVNLLALNTMVVTSIGTLLVNANPLMRYDGYYLLADLCETSNLWQRSRDAWQSRASTLFFKSPPGAQRESAWLAVFGAMSSAYMMVVLLTLFWMAMIALRPLGLGVIAFAIGGVMLVGVVARPAQQLTQTLSNPVRRRDFRPTVSLLVLLALALAGGLLWRMPVEDEVICQARVAPAAAQPIVTTMAGELQSALPAGEIVTAGEEIARLANSDVEFDAARLQGALRLALLKVRQLEALRPHDPNASSALPTARAEAAEVRCRIEEQRLQQQRLTLYAPSPGVVLPPPQRPAEDETLRLASWSGTPLETANRQAWIEAGTVVAVVGDPTLRDIVLAIDETDIELVQLGQRVRVQLSAVGSETLKGSIREIARMGADARATAQGLQAWMPSAPGVTKRYEARVQLDRDLTNVPIDSGGRAKVAVGGTTLGEWITRELRDTLRLP